LFASSRVASRAVLGLFGACRDLGVDLGLGDEAIAVRIEHGELGRDVRGDGGAGLDLGRALGPSALAGRRGGDGGGGNGGRGEEGGGGKVTLEHEEAP